MPFFSVAVLLYQVRMADLTQDLVSKVGGDLFILDQLVQSLDQAVAELALSVYLTAEIHLQNAAMIDSLPHAIG